eukprot:CAMPEP_0205930584 /NCGR_PEP_ID=MMETSP1325-20131115/25975_1 /ASSEMBLY_ACC=CAM_ASM_000708 /TAXON_ID=236786 /ORGANISM="Florenciella sp., Strain RCC1007" /LENGTH=86 /DNA_ID=CAMNT_0053299987 /DNA_START=99 /DNA_END=359 /DNA_ORIENTATION=-
MAAVAATAHSPSALQEGHRLSARPWNCRALVPRQDIEEHEQPVSCCTKNDEDMPDLVKAELARPRVGLFNGEGHPANRVEGAAHRK